MILILHFVMGHIIVVPITVESDLNEYINNDDYEDKYEDKYEDNDKINHWEIYDEMIRISINNPINWYSFE